MLKVNQIKLLSGYIKMLHQEKKIVIFGTGENGIKLSEKEPGQSGERS